MKKNIISLTIIITMIFTIALFVNAQTDTISVSSSVPSNPPTGSVWLEKSSSTNTSFTTLLYVDTGEQKLAAYGINITYNKNIIKIDKVVSGSEGYLAASNVDNNSGKSSVAGFDATGKGPDSKLELLKITWSALDTGNSKIEIQIDSLINPSTSNIGTPKAYNSNVTIDSAALPDIQLKKQNSSPENTSESSTESSSELSTEISPSPDLSSSAESSPTSSPSLVTKSKKVIQSYGLYVGVAILIIAVVVIIILLRKITRPKDDYRF